MYTLGRWLLDKLQSNLLFCVVCTTLVTAATGQPDDCRVTERAEIEAEEAERQRLEDMSEDEYDALDDDSKAKVDKKRLEIKKERLKKYDVTTYLMSLYKAFVCVDVPIIVLILWLQRNGGASGAREKRGGGERSGGPATRGGEVSYSFFSTLASQ